MKRIIILTLVVLAESLWGQTRPELSQAFLDLSHDGVAMNISAHPDDEDGASLAYYRMKHGVKTYSILLTRGEGGQNESGPDLYAELGVLRTEEAMKAAKILGTEAHFLNLTDFGYSKTATETFRFWGGREEVLRRLVYCFRKYKPDVVFTNHNTASGHGHHQATAITAIAAFDAAADPTAFPEQLSLPGVDLWQPRKMYFRLFNASAGVPDVSIKTDEVNGIYGSSYLEIASKALNQHRSQGFDQVDLRRLTRGQNAYKLARANSSYAPDTTTFFGGINLLADPAVASLLEVRHSLDSLNAGLPLKVLVDRVSFILRRMTLLEARMDVPLGQRLLSGWREELGAILREVCMLKIEARISDHIVIPGQEVQFITSVSSGNCDVRPAHLDVTLPSGWMFSEGDAYFGNRLSNTREWKHTVVPTAEVVPTLPKVVAQYNPIETNGVFRSDILLEIGESLVDVTAWESVDVARPLEVSVTPEVAWILPSRAGEGKEFTCRITNRFPHKIAGVVRVDAPAGWKAERGEFAIPAEDSGGTATILVRPPRGIQSGEYHLRFVTEYGYAEAVAKVFDVKTSPGIRLGIVKSYDNALEMAAGDLGVPFQFLNEQDLRQEDLKQFSTIIVDIRAYGMREDLRTNNARLLEYVNSGGHLVVMYQKPQDWKPEYAPYPFNIARSRVVDESAPVTALIRTHPLLTVPNMITEEDWRGWVQERGVYFPSSDGNTNYQLLLSSHDPDEPPLDTGYLVTHPGKGAYMYSSYVWYRQMKEKHEGALKCFANMISYPFSRE